MTITSSDNFGHGNTPVSMSELRTYFGGTNPISLNGSFNGGLGPVPDTLPAAGAETSFSDFRSQNRILKKKGTTQTITSGTSWTPAQSGCVQFNIYALGGGGSGGGAANDDGREDVASGGGAGGVAFRSFTDFSDSITSAAIAIGAGGSQTSRRSDNADGSISGYNGGTTSFNPDGDGTTISATGGLRGFGSRQGLATTTPTTTTPVGQNSTAVTGGDWGQCSPSAGGTGSGGSSNYTGGKSSGLNVGGNQTAANAGGSPNFGAGGTFDNGGTPTKPSEWGSDVAVTFQGGAANSFPNYPVYGGTGASYGAGGGGAATQSGGDAVRYVGGGAGSQGAIFVTYYELNS
jgi:hypothetical protein